MDIPVVPLGQWSGVEGRPLVLAGPCSAESEAQVFETARRLSSGKVDYLRAGIWKARTRPDAFEGIGAPALSWLKRAADRHGMRAATEVAHGHHVEVALEAGIDLLWIGARTTVNPFSVQEIANALRGSDVPVLVKNPTSPDLGLWVGALERMSRAGVRKLGAVHRGISQVSSAPFRNSPMWDIVIELRRLVPQVPILCDPSHICGRRDLLLEVAQQAMDLGLDGIMIEAHPDPDHAWSDAEQQVTPERAGEIIAELHVRSDHSSSESFENTLKALRERIDAVDSSLVGLLAERMGIVELIGKEKRDSNVTSLQVARWRALLTDRMQRAQQFGLDPTYVKALYDVIHTESVRRQSRIMSDESPDPPAAECEPKSEAVPTEEPTEV